MKKYRVSFSSINGDFDGDYEVREVSAQSIIDAVAIVQKELIDEGKKPGDYIYASMCGNELYACEGVPQ